METVLSPGKTLPTYQAFMNPVLECCQDGLPHTVQELEEYSCNQLSITADQRDLLIPSGLQTIVRNRTNWAAYYLKRAGCLDSVKKGLYKITPRGQTLVSQNIVIDTKYLECFEEFVAFRKARKTSEGQETIQTMEASTSTPEEIIGSAYLELKRSLADELLEKIKTISPRQFEFLVVDVLSSMGYGGGLSRKQELIEVTSYTNDKGIDGIIKEDALGLDQVCIQAKRYTNGSVSRPEVQGFAGSMDGRGAKKGIFITTSTFTKDAVSFAKELREKRIILIDGERLAMLMIENAVGVTEIDKLILYRLDDDYFESFV